MPYECPVCHKVVKNLKKHQKRMHPEPASHLENQAGEEEESKTEEFSIQVDNVKKPGKYHCVDCGATVSYHQSECPSCGTSLNWGEL